MSPSTQVQRHSLAGRVMLVTGASGGIGAAIAAGLAEAGAQVVVQGRETSAALRAASHEGRMLIGSLSSLAEAERLVDALLAQCGRLDGVVHAAGIYPSHPLHEIDESAWREVLAVNLDSAFHLLRATRAPLEAGGGGAFIAISSIHALHPAPLMAAYNTSKAALLALLRSAAQELGPLGVRVNAVSPGLVERPGIAEAWPEGVAGWTARAPLRRLGRPQDVADACCFLASDAAAWITGQDLVVDGGMTVAPLY